MKRTLSIALIGVGLLLVGVMMATAAETTPPAPQSPHLPLEDATYIGSSRCAMCHRDVHDMWSKTLHPYMIQDVAAKPEAILGDFSTGEEVRQVEISGETRAYAAADVTFTMGSKYRQRYIMQTDGGSYQVLPGQWNVDSARWVEADPGNWLSDCAGCHTTGYNPSAQTWSELSVGCEACHGPGSIHLQKISSGDMAGAAGAIVKTVDAAVCGQCHTRGKSPNEYGYPEGYAVGGPLDVAMFAPSLPVEGGSDDWWPDGTEKKHREQYVAWSMSKHGTALADLKAQSYAQDGCLACHSTDYNNQKEDAPVTLDNAQFSITCVQCHAPHGEAEIENQLTKESYELCTGCHNATGGGAAPITAGGAVHHPMQEMFEGTAFLDLKGDPSFHFENPNGPVCASCHMVGTAKSADYGDIPTHTWKIIRPAAAVEGQPDSCTGCHTPERDPDNAPENLTAFIEQVQAATHDRVEAIHADLDPILEAHPEWDAQAESKPEEQKTAETIVTLVSFVEADGSWGFHNPDYADAILTEAEDMLDALLGKLE